MPLNNFIPVTFNKTEYQSHFQNLQTNCDTVVTISQLVNETAY